MLLSKCAVCGSKNSKFIKQQEASVLLSSLRIKIPLSKIPFLFLKKEKILFCLNSIKLVIKRYKMK